jgi:outer membrane protein assembly factor BamB
MKVYRIESKSLMTLLLTIVIAFSVFTVLPVASASNEVPTYAFVSAAPNPIGVGQTASVLMWLDKLPPILTAEGSWAAKWHGYTLTITKPDGQTESFGPLTSDPTAFAYQQFTPAQVGTYTLKFSFLGEQTTGESYGMPVDDYYLPSTSSEVKLIVQQEPITPIPQTPLPTGYWSRPINAQNHDWHKISGNWLGGVTYNSTGSFNPYSKAPDSAHIVWTKPLTIGGLIGGEYGGSTLSNYYTGKLYEFYFNPPVIINGVLYYNEAQPPRDSYYAVDLRTGETIWKNKSPSTEPMNLSPWFSVIGYPTLSCGQIYNYKSPNQEGGLPYLWYTGGFTWYMYDAVTGDLICQFENASTSGTLSEGPNGEILYYILDGYNNWLALWNSSAIPQMYGGESGSEGWMWRPPAGSTLDWTEGIQWNVTTPSYQQPSPQAIFQINSGILLATSGNEMSPGDWQMETAYNATTGEFLWVQNRTTPVGSTTYGLMATLSDGVYVEYHVSARQYYGFNASTGEQIWGPTEVSESAWASQPSHPNAYSFAAYGNLYHMCMDGIHAVRLSDGERLWDFSADATGYEVPGMSTYPFMQSPMGVADGKVFVAAGQQYGDPLVRGVKMYALDAVTGEEAWSVSGFYVSALAIADGYLVCYNGYDNQIYCYGRGLTATTITATPGVGNTVTIQGTVTDQSPGETCLGVPAAGTPAIADEYMSLWMEYLYMQQQKPTDAKGVPVSIMVLDANGNTVYQGTAMSDITGNYAVGWTPDISGLYTITATFAGTGSYFSSSAETYINVDTASQTVAPTSSASPSTAPSAGAASSVTTYIAITAVVIIILVVAAAIALRRRK